MKKVSKKDIADYINLFNPIDKAGAYGIQELDEVFIDRIEGDYDNVVGLPLNKLRKLLKDAFNFSATTNIMRSARSLATLVFRPEKRSDE
jgi:predicted house-cleaning NTP pyrophosphatase (Maf/HAM1 superfamily)